MGGDTPIYASDGSQIGTYDSQTGLAFDIYGNALISNGGQVAYDASSGMFVIPTTGATVGVPVGATGQNVSPGAPPSGVNAQSWAAMFTQAVPGVINGLQAWQLAQINVQRAQNGLPPLNTALYATGQSGFMANMSSNFMLYAALGIGLFLVMGNKRGGK